MKRKATEKKPPLKKGGNIHKKVVGRKMPPFRVA